MSYENDFYKQFRDLSNPNSQYYQKAYSSLRDSLNAASPTTNSLLGIQMAMGGSYKGSIEAARRQREASQTKINESANQGINSLYLNSQGQANQALQGAQSAYEYEDSQPTTWDYLAGIGSTVAGSLTGGLLGKRSPNNNLQAPQMQNFQMPNTNVMQGGFNNPNWRF